MYNLVHTLFDKMVHTWLVVVLLMVHCSKMVNILEHMKMDS